MGRLFWYFWLHKNQLFCYLVGRHDLNLLKWKLLTSGFSVYTLPPNSSGFPFSPMAPKAQASANCWQLFIKGYRMSPQATVHPQNSIIKYIMVKWYTSIQKFFEKLVREGKSEWKQAKERSTILPLGIWSSFRENCACKTDLTLATQTLTGPRASKGERVSTKSTRSKKQNVVHKQNVWTVAAGQEKQFFPCCFHLSGLACY